MLSLVGVEQITRKRPEEFHQAWRLSREENPKFPHLLFLCLPVYLFDLKLHNLNKPEVNYYRYHKSIFRHPKCTQVELPGRVWWRLNIQCLFFKKKLPWVTVPWIVLLLTHQGGNFLIFFFFLHFYVVVSELKRKHWIVLNFKTMGWYIIFFPHTHFPLSLPSPKWCVYLFMFLCSHFQGWDFPVSFLVIILM